MSSHKVPDSQQQQQNDALRTLIVKLTCAIAIICIVAGLITIVLSANAATAFTLFGMAKVTTGSVGVAFVAIGLLIYYFIVRDVLRPPPALAPVRARSGRSGPYVINLKPTPVRTRCDRGGSAARSRATLKMDVDEAPQRDRAA